MNNFDDLYEPISPEDPQDSSKYFEQVFKRLNIDLNDPKRQLSLQWESFVPENFKGHTVFKGVFENSILVVCDHPSYVTLFKMTKGEVLKKIKTTFPELGIEKINVKLKN